MQLLYCCFYLLFLLLQQSSGWWLWWISLYHSTVHYYFVVRWPIQFGFTNELDVIRNSVRQMRNSCKWNPINFQNNNSQHRTHRWIFHPENYFWFPISQGATTSAWLNANPSLPLIVVVPTSPTDRMEEALDVLNTYTMIYSKWDEWYGVSNGES